MSLCIGLDLSVCGLCLDLECVYVSLCLLGVLLKF